MTKCKVGVSEALLLAITAALAGAGCGNSTINRFHELLDQAEETALEVHEVYREANETLTAMKENLPECASELPAGLPYLGAVRTNLMTLTRRCNDWVAAIDGRQAFSGRSTGPLSRNADDLQRNDPERVRQYVQRARDRLEEIWEVDDGRFEQLESDLRRDEERMSEAELLAEAMALGTSIDDMLQVFGPLPSPPAVDLQAARERVAQQIEQGEEIASNVAEAVQRLNDAIAEAENR